MLRLARKVSDALCWLGLHTAPEQQCSTHGVQSCTMRCANCGKKMWF